MGPSNDFRQMRLHEQPRVTPLRADAELIRRRAQEEQRATCIDYWCDHFREGGSEIKLLRPNTDPRLHLFVNGKLAGVFIERNGETSFCSVK